MTQDARKIGREAPVGGELALADVTGFLGSNWKFIGLLTLLLSAAVVSTALLLPQQYNKQFTLDINAVPTELSVELNQRPVLDDAQIGNLAVEYLQNATLEGVIVNPAYNITTRQVNVALQSRSKDALEAAVPALVKLLEDKFLAAYEKPLGAALEAQVSVVERELETNREALGSIDGDLKRTLAGNTDLENPRIESRVDGLEAARADTLVRVVRSEVNLRNLEEMRRNVLEIAAEAVAVEVLSESEAQQSRSLVPVSALALMLGLVGAVVAALVRTVLRRTG